MRALLLLIGGLFAVGSMSLVSLAVALYILKNEASPPERLEILITNDLNILSESNSLPKELHQLANVEVFGGTDATKIWIQKMKFPFKTSEEGTHDLEVLLVDWTENSKEGVMVQYNLNEKASGNMVWELGRTFILSDQKSLYFKLRQHLMNCLRH